MSRSKVVIASLLALLAAAVVASASASAAEWHVNGSTGAIPATKITEKVITIKEGLLVGDGLEITCPKVMVSEGQIEGTNSAKASGLTFTECSVKSPATCVLKSTTITSAAVTAKAELAEKGTVKGVMIHFSPAAGEEFATIKFKVGCPIAGEVEVHGTAQMFAPEGRTEKVSQIAELATTKASNELFVGGGTLNSASLEGKGSLELKNGQDWSFS